MRIWFALLAFAPLSFSAYADTTTAGLPDGSSSFSTENLLNTLKDKAAFSYFGDYRGAAVNDPGNKDQPLINGALDPNDTQSMESYVTTGYRINPNTTVGVISHFFWSPVGNPTTKGDRNFEWLDPALTLQRKNLIQNGNFSVKGVLNVYIPQSQYDILKSQGLDTAAQVIMNANYDVPGTKLSLANYGYVTYYVPGADHAARYRDYKIYLGPNATYQATDKVAATLWIDGIQAVRKNYVDGGSGPRMFRGLQNYDCDIEPGVNWEFVKNWNFNPMLNIYPKTMTWAATSFQAVVAGKFF